MNSINIYEGTYTNEELKPKLFSKNPNRQTLDLEMNEAENLEGQPDAEDFSDENLEGVNDSNLEEENFNNQQENNLDTGENIDNEIENDVEDNKVENFHIEYS
jgi:hypothetical protein